VVRLNLTICEFVLINSKWKKEKTEEEKKEKKKKKFIALFRVGFTRGNPLE
jgi:hypothetical protein